MSSIRSTSAAILLTVAALGLVGPQPVLAQAAVDLVVVDVHAVAKGYRLGKLMGRNVVNDTNQLIGEIDDFVATSKERILYVVIEVGGFLGGGKHMVSVPFASLVLDDEGRKITLPGASKDALRKLPAFNYLAV